jgi:hypothetical protein
MSPGHNIGARLIWCVIVVAALLGVSATRQAADTVPEYLVAATERPLPDFLVLLANASIRAGLELKEADNAPRSAVVPPKGERTQIPRDQLVAAFNARRPGYHAAWVGDVLLIRPVLGRMEFLDSPSPIQAPTTIVSLTQALRTIFSPINPTPPNSVAAGSLSGNEAWKAWTERFVLDGSNGRTVIDTLNQVTLQHQGAWWVTTRLITDRWQPTEFGFVYSDLARSRTRMMP